MAKSKLTINNGKTPPMKLGASAKLKPKSSLFNATSVGGKRNHKKSQLPSEAFAMPGFGDTGLTGES